MKRLILDQAWTLCLKQWRWIAKRVRAKSRKDVEALKDEWVAKHGFKKINNSCFFCTYHDQHPTKFSDKECNCPARKIDPNFDCLFGDCAFDVSPLKFYAKLLELNRKRKGAKK